MMAELEFMLDCRMRTSRTGLAVHASRVGLAEYVQADRD